MGKRQRRRKRQQSAGQNPAAVERHLIPSREQPLLEVYLEPGLSADDSALCLAYWAFSEPGTWTHKVASLGAAHLVSKKVKEACHAVLLTQVCPDCASPSPVYTRSDVTAAVPWSADGFPLEETTARMACKDCRDTQAEAARLERAAAVEQARVEQERSQEAQRKDIQERSANASQWLANHRERSTPRDLAPREALFLLSVVDIMQATSNTAFGPICTAEYTVSSSTDADVQMVRTLYQKNWIAPTLPAKVEDFAYEDDNTVCGVYPDRIPWRLAYSFGDDDVQARRDATDELHYFLADEDVLLRDVLVDLEASMAVDYLNGILNRKYREDPVPDHRLPDAYETFRDALKDGFNLAQLVAVAWGATSTSVAWGQRTPGLKPGSVSAASVTNCARRIGYAKDRPVPEYDLPNWVARPAMHATALRLVEAERARTAVLGKFLTLKQRISSAAAEAYEMEADFDEGREDFSPIGQGLVIDVERLRSGRPGADRGTPISYMVVTPDGALRECKGSAAQMRCETNTAGGGMVDRIMIDETPTVNAYIGELVEASTANLNPVGHEMLRLLGSNGSPLLGPISFFCVGLRHKVPRSLDDAHQELIRAAYEVAKDRILNG